MCYCKYSSMKLLFVQIKIYRCNERKRDTKMFC